MFKKFRPQDNGESGIDLGSSRKHFTYRATNKITLGRLLMVSSYALCLWYILSPSIFSGGILLVFGMIFVLLRPEVGTIFMGFGWIGQRQVMTYSTGIPLFIVGFISGLLSLRGGLRRLRHDGSFMLLLSITILFSLITLFISPLWRNAAFNRLLSVTAAIMVYSLCSRPSARQLFRIASICCGVIIAGNAIIAARIYGKAIVHLGDMNEFQLSDANYASIPLIFGVAIALQYLRKRRFVIWEKMAFSFALVIMVWGILLLASRGAQLAVGLLAVIWIMRLIIAPLSQIGSVARIGTVFLIAGSIFLLIINMGSNIIEGNRSRWDDAFTYGGSLRTDIYNSAFDAIKAKPLNIIIGGGVGHNLELLGGRNAHNQILDTLFDYGILGVFSLVWFWIRLIIGPSAGWNKLSSEMDSTTLAALGLGFAAMLLSPIWFTFFWIEIAYLAACTVPSKNNDVINLQEKLLPV